MSRLILPIATTTSNAGTAGISGEIKAIPGVGLALHDGSTPGGLMLSPAPEVAGENLLRNGNFIVTQNGSSWQGIPTSGNVHYIADGWHFHRGGNSTANVASARSLANDLPEAYTALRVTTSSGGLSSSFSIISQQIAGVQAIGGRTVAVSFWAKTTSVRRIAVTIRQDYKSTKVVETFVGNVELTQNWKQYSFVVSVPASISTDTIGANSFTGLWIWLEAGADYDQRTGGIGVQSGQTDIANVKLEIGSAATLFGPTSIPDELLKVQRYYEVNSETLYMARAGYNNTSSVSVTAYVPFSLPKAKTPVVSVTTSFASGTATAAIGTKGFNILAVATSASSIARVTGYVANAEFLPF